MSNYVDPTYTQAIVDQMMERKARDAERAKYARERAEAHAAYEAQVLRLVGDIAKPEPVVVDRSDKAVFLASLTGIAAGTVVVSASNAS